MQAASADIYGSEWKRPQAPKVGTRSINAVDFVAKLAAACPGLHADVAGRHGLWSPRQMEFQGLFYFAKHICGMDRGVMPEWPEMEWEEEMVRVPVEVAAREDIPLFSLDAVGAVDPQSANCGFAMRPTSQKILKVGWRDTMHKVLRAKLPGITKHFLETTFRVSLDGQGERSPRPMRAAFGGN